MVTLLGKEVGQVGFGLMGLSWRTPPPPLEQSIATMKAALDSGCTVWNGAEFYGTAEYNSMTILKAYFTKYPEDAEKVTLVIKGGMSLVDHAPDGSPDGIRRSLDNIISQLGGTKKLDVFSSSRRDPKTPLQVTFATIQKEYIDTGKLGAVGLSECGPDTIHEAAKLTKIACAEVELSLLSTDILKNGIAKACAEHDIPILAYSPNGRGLLTGAITTPDQVKGIASKLPRYQSGAFQHNLQLADQVSAVAKTKGCTPAQLAIAWVRAQSGRPGLPSNVIPIPGATTASRVQENAQAVELAEEEFDKLSSVGTSFEAVGGRYPAQMPTNT